MDDKKPDRRVRKTEKQLEDALTQLLKTKSISRISVRELAEAADITRATFYTHYRDAYDMLSQIQNRMVGKIISFIAETTGRDPERFFKLLFTYLAQEVAHPEFLFYDTGDGSAFERIGNTIRESYMLRWIEYPGSSLRDYEYYRSYTIFGCVAIIQKWIDNGMEETPDYMTDIAMKLLPSERRAGIAKPEN